MVLAASIAKQVTHLLAAQGCLSPLLVGSVEGDARFQFLSYATFLRAWKATEKDLHSSRL
jgi:hypothetical protein